MCVGVSKSGSPALSGMIWAPEARRAAARSIMQYVADDCVFEVNVQTLRV
jgi:hypothetical protein